MSTYATLKTRIIAETHRDDLTSDLATVLDQHVANACDYFADERFWFNRVRTTTTASAATVALPATVRVAEKVFCTGELAPVTMEEIPETQDSGTPLRFASYGDSLWLDPVPSGSVTLTITGTLKVAAPSADADDSIWTNEAAKLICARTKYTLYRDVFRDSGAAGMALAEATEELARLKGESRRRDKAPLRADAGLLPVTTTILR